MFPSLVRAISAATPFGRVCPISSHSFENWVVDYAPYAGSAVTVHLLSDFNIGRQSGIVSGHVTSWPSWGSLGIV